MHTLNGNAQQRWNDNDPFVRPSPDAKHASLMIQPWSLTIPWPFRSRSTLPTASPKRMQSARKPSISVPVPALSSLSPSFSTLRFVLLCMLWYTSSALSSNTGKTIMTHFRYPITLTLVQFFFVALYCLIFMSPAIRFTRFRPPTRAIITNTLPMGMFQVGGHVFSSIAISRIPVSTVHTVKALSPLFTVLAYAFFFRVKYNPKTYISLIPLTFGVMLACSFDTSASNFIGLICAFGSAIVFVSSNIFFKKLMPSTSETHTRESTNHGLSTKLDRLNLLLYSSSMAFLLMIPIWLYYDFAPLFLLPSSPTSSSQGAHSTFHYFAVNGSVHFLQNIIAFIILSSTSPVTYSIASLIKRVVVILMAIVWFNQSVHVMQALGIALTFGGLWMYNQSRSESGDVERGERKVRAKHNVEALLLPVTQGDAMLLREVAGGSPEEPTSASVHFGMMTNTGSGVRSRPPHATSHGHAPPPLSIRPRSKTQSSVALPSTPPGYPTPLSYPSPPPSLDSPRQEGGPLWLVSEPVTEHGRVDSLALSGTRVL